MGLLSKLIRPVFAAFAAFALISSGSVAGQCTGSPPMLNGLPCATTTRYWDGQLGACGCGSNNAPFSWQWTSYTAAGSQAIFDPSGSSWCGDGCGECYELTPTGQCPTGGECAPNMDPITVMVTNLCPNAGNEEWCPNPGETNSFGYGAHFDLMDLDMSGLITELGWNNPVVTYQRVPCNTNLGSPSCAEAATCECSTSSCSNVTTPTPTAAAAPTAHATAAPTAKATAAPTVSATKPPASASPTSPSIVTSACRAGISSQLAGSWDNGGQVSITISNTGSEPINGIQVSLPGQLASWNLLPMSTSGQYTLPAWAFPIAPGATFTSAGFTFSGAQPAAASVASVSC